MNKTKMTCWPLRFSSGLFQQESRNFGLIALPSNGSAAISKLMGARGHEVNTRYFCKAFGLPESYGWIYHEWTYWFGRLAGESESHEAIQNALDVLDAKGSRFGAGERFTAYLQADESPNVALDRIFNELVSVPSLPRRSRFDSVLENVILRSEIEYTTSFHRNVEMEILTGTPGLYVQLPFFVEAPVPVAIKLMRFEGTTDKMVADMAGDILYTFDTLEKHAIVDRKHCVVLFDGPVGKRERHLARISASATLLHLDQPDTPRGLRSLTWQ